MPASMSTSMSAGSSNHVPTFADGPTAPGVIAIDERTAVEGFIMKAKETFPDEECVQLTYIDVLDVRDDEEDTRKPLETLESDIGDALSVGGYFPSESGSDNEPYDDEPNSEASISAALSEEDASIIASAPYEPKFTALDLGQIFQMEKWFETNPRPESLLRMCFNPRWGPLLPNFLCVLRVVHRATNPNLLNQLYMYMYNRRRHYGEWILSVTEDAINCDLRHYEWAATAFRCGVGCDGSCNAFSQFCIDLLRALSSASIPLDWCFSPMDIRLQCLPNDDGGYVPRFCWNLPDSKVMLRPADDEGVDLAVQWCLGRAFLFCCCFEEEMFPQQHSDYNFAICHDAINCVVGNAFALNAGHDLPLDLNDWKDRACQRLASMGTDFGLELQRMLSGNTTTPATSSSAT